MSPYIHPGWLITHVANPVLRHVGRTPALIVRGRRTGKLLTVPMGEPVRFEGRRYLVSGRGETHWVRNLRAAGRGEFRVHSQATAFRPTEVFGSEHDRVIAAYRHELGRRVDPYFDRLPELSDHPVFRMDPVDDPSLSGSGGRARR